MSLVIASAVLIQTLTAPATARECRDLRASYLLDNREVVFAGIVRQIAAVPQQSAVAVTFLLKERFTDEPAAPMPQNEVVLYQVTAPNTSPYVNSFQVSREYLVFAFKNTSGQLAAAPREAYVSRTCERWDLAYPAGQKKLIELNESLP